MVEFSGTYYLPPSSTYKVQACNFKKGCPVSMSTKQQLDLPQCSVAQRNAQAICGISLKNTTLDKMIRCFLKQRIM